MPAAKILVVDDEPAVLGLVSNALSVRGYAVHAASCPLKALELAKTAVPCFDLLLADVIMPGMCGPELAKKFTEISPSTAVVMMSAYVGVEELPQHAKFIGKPFLVSDLYSVVGQALGRSPE